jgi:quinol monooxygenase YgiN
MTNHSMRAAVLSITAILACSSDDDDDDGLGEDTTVAESSSGGATTVGATTTVGAETTFGTDTTDANDTTVAAEDSTGTGDESSTGEPEQGSYAALVRGALFTDDLDEAQAYHDQVAAGAMDAAIGLGDFGHDVLLGTDLLGTHLDEFTAIDQWSSLDGAITLYSDPMFQAGFGGLFAAPVAPELFELQPQWYSWGDLEAADDGDEHFFVIVRGYLSGTPEEIQPMHDAVAAQLEPMTTAAGDVAHVVWLGVEDPRELMAVDVWSDDAAIEAIYGDPMFQTALGPLFESPPTLSIVRSTDWVQW